MCFELIFVGVDDECCVVVWVVVFVFVGVVVVFVVVFECGVVECIDFDW